MKLHSYPSIYNIGHAAIADLLKSPVIVEEKVDGSQISFGLDTNGDIVMRSKGAEINTVCPEAMFKQAVETVTALKPKLLQGFTYRGEYLAKPKHNCLLYSRIPKSHIIIFDVNCGLESYVTPEEKKAIADSLNLECVPVLFQGIIENVEQFRSLLDTESVLGGQKIEGVVIKPADYNLFGRDKKVLMGKFVSESFRETHAKTWNAEHRITSQDIVILIGARYNNNARWNKAIIHLREKGLLESSPRDIGLLMKEIPEDILKECEEEIKNDLFKWAWPHIRRHAVAGLPEWYKEELLKNAFK